MPYVLKINITHCARCGQDHAQLEFVRFSNKPIIDLEGIAWDWWAICPVANDPILMKNVDEEYIAQRVREVKEDRSSPRSVQI